MQGNGSYEDELRRLQIELVKLQHHLIARGEKVLILLEGRDAAGKDGSIKRLVEHMSPRETRVVALAKPSQRDEASWYFQRWVSHLPAAGEFVLFNRSWYNRAGVEHVMGFCSKAEYKEFLASVPEFEKLLLRGGIHLSKYYLDISRAEQKQRLAERRQDPLAQWKTSPIDDVALRRYDAYTKARDAMLLKTSSRHAPWYIIAADRKKQARLALIRHILSCWDYPGKGKHLEPDAKLVFTFAPRYLKQGRLQS